MNVRTRYLIIGGARTGTTAFSTMLDGHPEISSLVGELQFDVLARGTHGFSVKGYATENAKAKGPALLFDAITSAEADENTTTLGAKITVNSRARADSTVATLREHFPGIKIILIQRDDLVALYGSRAQLRRTGLAHVWDNRTRKPATSRIRINPWLLMQFVIANLDTYSALAKLSESHDVLRVSHEQFCKDPTAAYRETAKFLGVRAVEPLWVNSRKVLPPASEYIHNYEGLCSIMRDTRTAHASGHISDGKRKLLGLCFRVALLGRKLQKPLHALKARLPASAPAQRQRSPRGTETHHRSASAH